MSAAEDSGQATRLIKCRPSNVSRRGIAWRFLGAERRDGGGRTRRPARCGRVPVGFLTLGATSGGLCVVKGTMANRRDPRRQRGRRQDGRPGRCVSASAALRSVDRSRAACCTSGGLHGAIVEFVEPKAASWQPVGSLQECACDGILVAVIEFADGRVLVVDVETVPRLERVAGAGFAWPGAALISLPGPRTWGVARRGVQCGRSRRSAVRRFGANVLRRTRCRHPGFDAS